MGRQSLLAAAVVLLSTSTLSAGEVASSRAWVEITKADPSSDIVTKPLSPNAASRFSTLGTWGCVGQTGATGDNWVSSSLRCSTAEGSAVMITVHCNTTHGKQHEKAEMALYTAADYRIVSLHCAVN